ETGADRAEEEVSATSEPTLRGCEEILSEGGSEGRERRIFGYTGSTLPTERRRNHRPRCATNRTVCAIGPSPAGVTEDPSLPPLGPHPAQDFFTPSERSEGSLVTPARVNP